jgi:glycosyltransferase involved in cell wall biosynthesis
MATLVPSVRQTWHKAAIRLTETPNTKDALPKQFHEDVNTRILNRVLLQDVPARAAVEVGSKREPFLLFPSALQGRKGPRLAIHALAHASETARLIFVNDGYESAALQRLARKLGVDQRVEFRGRIRREDMLMMMSHSAAVVLTGLREVGGMALSEAMMLGTPVIALANGGATLIAEYATDQSRIALIESTSPDETSRRLGEAMTRFIENPWPSCDGYLDRDRAKRALHKAIQDAVRNSA